ncbi:membrane protein insertase YidC [bacterium]|nr:membrane protein insertase YidC [bacterium]
MEDRALLAIILSILIIVLYQYLFAPRRVIKQETPEKNEEIAMTDMENPPEMAHGSNLKGILESQKDRIEKEFTIENEHYKAIFSNKGGCLKSWKLKEYKEETHYETWPLKKSFWRQTANAYIALFRRKDDKGEDASLVEMAPEPVHGAKPPLDIKLSTEIDAGGEDAFAEGIYEVTERKYSDDQNNNIRSLVMSFLDDRGIMIEKEFRFFEKGYSIELDIRMKNVSGTKQGIDYALTWGPGIRREKAERHHRFVGTALWADGKKTRIKPKKVKETIRRKGFIEWIAYENTYFAASIIPQKTESEALIYKETAEHDELVTIGVRYPARIIGPGEEVQDSYAVYIGPKRDEDVKGVTAHFAEIIDYGWFSFLARPSIWFLKKSYSFLPNYGFAIIILTLIIKIVFWPLTEKGFGSMREMQKIQPKMAALREKHKSDPTRMNKEVMELYKSHGVNPLGGCLPLVLQIPVFFALYEALLVSIEIRGAPFMLWINDLSAMDPLLITPVLMGISMFIQQKMTPTGMDPKQAQMMYWMPVIFTVFFLGFPSGLVIYWLLNNVLTIAQQYMMQRRTEKAAESKA